MSPTGGERDSGNGRPHVLILGGGFAGLYAARALAGTPVRLTLIDRKNHHLFQPLLYQVATAGLAAPSIAEPIRRVLRKQKNATVLLGEARSIDVERQAVLVDDEELGYDYLIVATGSESHYSGHDEWQKTAPGLKSVEDAFEIRRRVLLAFEAAERERDPALRREWLRGRSRRAAMRRGVFAGKSGDRRAAPSDIATGGCSRPSAGPPLLHVSPP